MSSVPPLPGPPPLPGSTRVCPKCKMHVPAKAYVCAYCKKRLRTSPALSGCLIVLGVLFAFSVISTAFKSSPPPPAPITPEQQAEHAAQAKAAQEKAAEAEAAFLKTPAGRIWKKHPTWDREICGVIAEKKIRIGMTAEQIRAAWGKPEKVNSTITARGTHEQWVYGDGQYVYFDEGVMRSLQQSN